DPANRTFRHPIDFQKLAEFRSPADRVARLRFPKSKERFATFADRCSPPAPSRFPPRELAPHRPAPVSIGFLPPRTPVDNKARPSPDPPPHPRFPPTPVPAAS